MDHERARRELEECRDIGLSARAPNNWVLAEAYLCLFGDSTETTRAALDEHRSSLYLLSIMEARFQLWRAEGRREDLDQARKLLSGKAGGPHWSSDGRTLAFTLDQPFFEIWTADVASLGPGRTIATSGAASGMTITLYVISSGKVKPWASVQVKW